LFFFIASIPALGSHPISFPIVTVGSFNEVKWLGFEAEPSLPSTNKANKDGIVPPLPRIISVIKHRDKFTFYSKSKAIPLIGRGGL
jgi:hypothetical protein